MKGVEMKRNEIYCCSYIPNLEGFPIIKMYVTAMLADFKNF